MCLTCVVFERLFFIEGVWVCEGGVCVMVTSTFRCGGWCRERKECGLGWECGRVVVWLVCG